MTTTGWIIFVVVAVIAILAAFVLMRRKPTGMPRPYGNPTGMPVPETPVEADITPLDIAPPPVAPMPPVMPLPEEFEVQPRAAPQPPRAEPEEPLAPAPVAPAEILPTLSGIAPEVPPAPMEGDDLRRLKGVGPKIVALLHGEGITRYSQIAAWTDADIAAIDAKLGSFTGRPKRDNWVDQAQLLATGDVAGYEAKYGKL